MANPVSTAASNTNIPATKPETPTVETKQIVLTEIGAKWDKFSAQDLSGLAGKDDLVAQVVAKYGLDKVQALHDVEALLAGRQF